MKAFWPICYYLINVSWFIRIFKIRFIFDLVCYIIDLIEIRNWSFRCFSVKVAYQHNIIVSR